MAKRGKRKRTRRARRKRTKEATFDVIRERRSMVHEYLRKHPCVDCPESDIVVLQFDHVRGRKFENISTMIRMGYTETEIIAEIAKCDVRCANCHTRKTAREQNWVKGRPCQ